MLHWLRPHHTVRGLHELECEMLVARGIRGVMIDLDNTLARWRIPEVSTEVAAWGERARRHGLDACIVTNALHPERVKPVAEALGIPWVTHAVKPLSGGFFRGMRELGTTPETTAMVGDMLLTDILGANRLGLFTVLVEPICRRQEALTARFVQRPVEWLLGRVAGVRPDGQAACR